VDRDKRGLLGSIAASGAIVSGGTFIVIVLGQTFLPIFGLEVGAPPEITYYLLTISFLILVGTLPAKAIMDRYSGPRSMDPPADE
jgi:hypothetical protein